MFHHIQIYLDEVIKKYNSGEAREMAYRPAMQHLITSLRPDLNPINDPARISCGAPDFIILDAKNIPRGYIEAKDISLNILDDKKNQAQIAKYFDGELGYNFIHTDNIEFRFYRNRELVESVQIAVLQNGKIVQKPENFEKLQMLLENFLSYKTQTITSSKKLAEIMAGKARMIKRVIYMTLLNKKDGETEIHGQFETFKKILVHDLDETSFADIYAQTITYGLFTARLHDPTLPTFDRDEAARLLPKSNPFLKKFFQSLRDSLDPRIEWIVDDLVEIFLACDVKALLDGYGKTSARNDPIIHFYEDFLSLYDSKLRKAKGVYYTPEPVVNFMIRAVDHLLKRDFGLSDGLADTKKTKIKVQEPGKGGKFVTVEKEVHKVQVLDPATGTGTYLNDIIKYIHREHFSGMTGAWSQYVEEHLLPRLHGFEIMMASYAMAHLKLDLTLTETGYKNEGEKRLGIYLTNTLEDVHSDTGTLFANWLSTEASEANLIKRDAPIMTIIGNPPYSGESKNNGDWIMKLMEDYKKEPGGKEKLKERNPKWINDDYVKFMRFSQYFIEKNGEGILAFINPHGFLDNPTFRGVRWSLLNCYDTIYTIDLHGNSKKKEVCPDGSPDINVFDIQQGVSINFFIKNNTKKKGALAQVHHYDLYGKREFKYDWLQNNSLETIPFTQLPNTAPMYYMVQKDFGLEGKYNKGFSVAEIFPKNNVGIVTSRDSFVIDDDKNILESRIQDFFSLPKADVIQKYGLKENGTWKIEQVQAKAQEFYEAFIQKISYRPFDDKYIYYNDNFIERGRKDVMQHFVTGENIGLLTTKSSRDSDFNHVFTTNSISEAIFLSGRTATNAMNFPLYLYPSKDAQQTLEGELVPERVPNLNPEIIGEIEKKLGMKLVGNEYFHSEKSRNDNGYSEKSRNDNNRSLQENVFTPENLLDYIYAVLHSPNYRETYKEFLKIDFPRVPFGVSKEVFFEIAKLGENLRKLHLLEHESLTAKNFISKFEIDGNNMVEKVNFVGEQELGKVFISESQYFAGVPKHVWEFYIGGYQPAQKWLKDRKGRALKYEDIIHYSKIILTLSETSRIMGEIDEVFEV